MKKIALGLISAVLLTVSGLAAAAEQYIAGKDYIVVSKPGKVDIPGKIEVREFFWYGCPHCYKLEPYMQNWLRQLPKDINFVRTPAAMNPIWEQNARGYFVSEALGIRQKAHIPLFDAVNKQGQQLFDQKSLAQFYARYGANQTKFNSLYNSFAITGKVNQANNLAKYYQLTGVPAVVINGKYIVQGEDQRVVDIMNYLIQKERAGLKKAS
ncbi:thiol:disulfide interchange protein DsbA/DsbL [Acinetobacter qingfengensis]|uniref:Thiol:disulfide interchange protein n=1 Tax=Acinetobacter qingfengensis TaxID=1262585 RepID=A0A1E7R540_9GAMM|nr:thiol:disulfide interchange protein DsbA/DsbL [Acinetobacter qingfengensis]KAA8730922.1 thiol:disulfide interchange protein DsbA/DsbL [Acinetobacter qingfengensis]OEY94479.1 disulfide bond formation protein DsbA [Acinetobacter qingfengensis]